MNALRRENLPQSIRQPTGSRRSGSQGPRSTGADLGYPTMVVSGFETLGDDPNLPVVRRTRTIHIGDA